MPITAVISAELSLIFGRLGSTADNWWSRPDKVSRGRPLDRYFTAREQRVREVARLGEGGYNGEAIGRTKHKKFGYNRMRLTRRTNPPTKAG